jgi:hypothetical protein
MKNCVDIDLVLSGMSMSILAFYVRNMQTSSIRGKLVQV